MSVRKEPDRVVVVVTDDHSTALFVTTVLGRAGWTADWATSLDEALASTADLAFVDAGPNEDGGLATVRALRERAPDLLLVMIGNGARPGLNGSARSHGADSIVHRPLSSSALLCCAQAARTKRRVRLPRPPWHESIQIGDPSPGGATATTVSFSPAVGVVSGLFAASSPAARLFVAGSSSVGVTAFSSSLGPVGTATTERACAPAET